MGTKWPKRDVRINELQNLPHYEGQLVLDVVSPDREIKIFFHHGRYWVHCAITCGSVTWTRLMAGRDTIEEGGSNLTTTR
jgi:hypothetical protein